MRSVSLANTAAVLTRLSYSIKLDIVYTYIYIYIYIEVLIYTNIQAACGVHFFYQFIRLAPLFAYMIYTVQSTYIVTNVYIYNYG
jgi:hypothetical protein